MRSNPATGNATDKVLAVLAALPEHEGVTAIAAATGLPKSTVHRVLQSLVEHQFAINVGDGRYLGGPRLLTVAGEVMRRFDPARHAGGTLRRLAEQTGCTVHYALSVGDEAVYAAKVEGRKPYHMPSRVGMSIRLHTTAIGKAVLAGLAGLPRRTANTLTGVTALLADLAEVRKRGYSIDDEENETGIRCVGAAVHDHTGRVAGGVSVSTLALEGWPLPVPELGDRVRAAAADISASLGHVQ
jgi:IclR family acetate operon transcriptional repressor